MKVLRKTKGEVLKEGWVIKLQPPTGNTTSMALFKIVRVGESSAFCVPLSPIANKVFDNREQERSHYVHMGGSTNISVTSEVEVYGTHRNNLDRGVAIQ